MATDRRVRTKWIMRRRYRRLSDIATGVGLFVGLTIVALIWPHASGAWLDRKFLLMSSFVVLLTTIGPRLLVKAAWYVVLWRNYEEWS